MGYSKPRWVLYTVKGGSDWDSKRRSDAAGENFRVCCRRNKGKKVTFKVARGFQYGENPGGQS